MELNSIRHHTDSEDEDIDDQNWDDWEADDDAATEDQESDSQLLCLFCDSRYDSCSSLFKHCASTHSFHFQDIKKTLNLDFYGCFKLINYIRSQVVENKTWSFRFCCSDEQLRNDGQKSVNFEGNVFPWDDDRYLSPFLQDDALLYSFDEDDKDDEEDNAMSIDTKELAMHLSEFELLDIKETGVYGSELTSNSDNGGKDNTFSTGTNDATTLEQVVANGSTEISNKMVAFEDPENKLRTVSFTYSLADKIKKINKNYFGSYSSFGIHKDMISDKVRTDAYRQAIMENPSLLGGAVVMDVGCGTGILSLFAAQAGASRVLAVEASDKMVAVARQVAKDNCLLRNGIFTEGNQRNGVIEVVQGMIEDIGNAEQVQPQSVDVLISEWMGYCLLYESMLSSVLFARDRWLKPGGAILPDTATIFVAGFGRGGTSIPFWENVYGFNMSCIGQEVVEDAARIPIVDVIDSCNIVTTTEVLQSFDLATMQPKQMEFTAEVELNPSSDALLSPPSSSNLSTTWCYGVVLWFETGFTERFCKEKPVTLSTSPYNPSTHWSQTILTFIEPIALASNIDSQKLGKVGTEECPAVGIKSRISIVRAAKHRSIDISLELTAIGPDGRKQSWPGQLFNLD